MLLQVKVSTHKDGDYEQGPVLIELWGRDELPVELRLGERAPGRTRYHKLTREQARAIARALEVAAEAPTVEPQAEE